MKENRIAFRLGAQRLILKHRILISKTNLK